MLRALGFEITEEGVAHLTEHHAAYAAAYPKLNLPDPSGGVGWPEEAHRLLDELRGECWSLAHAAERAERAEKRAQEERARADIEFKEEFHRQEGQLALAMYREVSELKRAHARALADTFEGYRAKMRIVLAERLPQYTAATLAAVTAVVEGADPVAAIRAQTAEAVAELPGYTPTGVVAVDVEGERLYAECQRKRPRRATTTRKGKAKAATGLNTEAVPSPARGTVLEQPWALAVHRTRPCGTATSTDCSTRRPRRHSRASAARPDCWTSLRCGRSSPSWPPRTPVAPTMPASRSNGMAAPPRRSWGRSRAG
ncbi:hypothetical protein AB0D37_41010 [Streptomyces sp. NPDC048384]|uniref:hypothetical protein n=1 Tax=Streptomyces sp. NPDC048384 TaxID=3155487 RepID=UPI003420850C